MKSEPGAKINNLQKAVASAQQEFRAAEHKAIAARLGVRAAKAAAEKIRLEHKRARKVAKKTKKQAQQSESLAHELAGVLAKAQKRLAKALKKRGAVIAVRKPKAKVAAKPVGGPKPAPARKTSSSPLPVRPATDGHVIPPSLPGPLSSSQTSPGA